MFGYDLDMFTEPHNDDWKAMMWDAIAGAPGGTIETTGRGLLDIYNGEYARGAGEAMPIGVIANFFKGYTLGEEGAISRVD